MPAAIAGGRDITVTADDLRFSPSTITLKTGEAVNITVINSGQILRHRGQRSISTL